MGELYKRTDIYDLFASEEYYQACKRHWEAVLKETNIHSVLDCSIGTGNLTLPLAELGITLTGSDLSQEMLDACKRKAEQRKLDITVKQSDFRNLTDVFKEQFDCIASTGNSLPYVSNQEILDVLEQMDTLVKENGYLYYDMRNWDKILKEKNRFYLYNPHFKEDMRINLIQVWDYHEDGSMTFNLLYTFEKQNVIVQKEKFEEHYYPVKRDLMINKLKNMGYKEIKVMCHPAYFSDVDPEIADWYCVIAKKNGRS